MRNLQVGEFYGQTNQTIDLGEIILTDTEYTHDTVDWHYHENAYFTFILAGNVLEGNKKETYHCTAGSLLFHNWQDPHYNTKPPGFTRGFQIELKQSWFKNFSFDDVALQGSIYITNPDVKLLFYKIFKETKTGDDLSVMAIQSLLLQVLEQIIPNNEIKQHRKPIWANKGKEVLLDDPGTHHTLKTLAKTLDIHPVHLCRYFPKYFHYGLGEYVRRLRVEKSLSLLCSGKMSLTKIAFECGFADQSHFTRCFKDIMGINPFVYKKLMRG